MRQPSPKQQTPSPNRMRTEANMALPVAKVYTLTLTPTLGLTLALTLTPTLGLTPALTLALTLALTP